MRKEYMMKEKEEKGLSFPMNLQFFAGEDAGDEGSDGDDAGGDDQDDELDDDSDDNGEDEPKFTQKDMDEAIKKRIRRERRKWNAEAAAKKANDGKKDDGAANVDDRTANENKSLKAKLACYEAGVKKDAVDDVAILAKAYMDEDDSLDLEEAIEMVVEKHPGFVGKTEKKPEETDKKESGKKKRLVRGADGTYKPGSVTQEKAFLDQRYANNPYYKK